MTLCSATCRETTPALVRNGDDRESWWELHCTCHDEDCQGGAEVLDELGRLVTDPTPYEDY